MFPPQHDSYIKDMKNSWTMILLALVTSVLVALVFVILTSKFTRCVVYTFIVLYLACLVGLAVFCYNNSQPSKELDNTRRFQDPETLKDNAADTNNSPEMYFALFITFVVVAVVSLVLLLIFRKKVAQTIEFIDTSADFVEKNGAIIIVPLVSFLVILLYCLWWILIAVYLFSVGELVDLPLEERLPFAQFQPNPAARFLFVLHFISFFYFMAVIITFTQFIITGTYTYWYFMTAENMKDDPNYNPNSGVGKKTIK